MFPRTLTLQIDYDQSLKSPKLTVQEAYYKQKLKTYNLGIYCANDDTVHCFLYDETVGTIGPNEVISLLDYLLKQLESKLGKHDHIIVWCDNAPGQFKECYLFFYMDLLIRRGQFLRGDLKFLLEGHTYAVCDRRFGTIQKFLRNQEKIDVPRKWAIVLEKANLLNVAVHWVTLDMIKDYKTFLRLEYVSRNEDLEKEKFLVHDIAWLNFGYGERPGENGLELVHHPDSVFIRFKIDAKEPPRKVSFIKKKQRTELRRDFLRTLRRERQPIPIDVKNDCVGLAKDYLTKSAVQFYQSLPAIDKENKSK